MSADLPPADLLAARIAAAETPGRPVLIGLDGPVAVGKSTLARDLAGRLGALGLPTAVVGADGFLWPAASFQARRLMGRKGFPESFDRGAMGHFLRGVRAGAQPSAPSYAHAAYDVSQAERQATEGAAVVIFEGVNVLGADLAPLYDLRLFLDADPADVQRWFLARFVATPFGAARAAALAPWRPGDGDVEAWGRAVWSGINAPNWAEHIAHGRERADVVVRKAADHGLSIA